MSKAKKANKKLSQAGWTTMEYVVGAIALVGVVSAVLGVFKGKLIEAIGTLNLLVK